jgi:hypothetical protein
MAGDVALTAAQIAVCSPPEHTVIKPYVAGATLTAGLAVAITTTGTVVAADASTGGAHLIQFRGIALNGGVAGQLISVLHEGELYGFTVSALNVGATLALSNTAGALYQGGTGDVAVYCGVVSCLSDGPTITKVVRITTAWHHVWA